MNEIENKNEIPALAPFKQKLKAFFLLEEESFIINGKQTDFSKKWIPFYNSMDYIRLCIKNS